jgi:O-acetyl-ADP-ribose deacetylase (regulator of RNase III)
MTREGHRPKRRIRRAVVASATAVLLSAGGGSAWALNRYVVDHVEISDVRAYEAAQGSTVETSTGDATIKVTKVTTGSGNDTVTYYVADVTLTDATQLRSAFADNSFG